MKHGKKKTAVCLLALSFVLTAAGCKKNDSPKDEAGEAGTTVSAGNAAEYSGQLELKEGDKYAITKLSGDIPAVFDQSHEDDFVRLYANAYSKIEISGANYKENYAELETFADNMAANIEMNRRTMSMSSGIAQDFTYEKPVETKAAGFDAILYNYAVVVSRYLYILDEDGNFTYDDDGRIIVEKDAQGKEKKEPVDYLRGQAYFFASDRDVFYVVFESKRDEWDTYYPEFQKFFESITITE
jgi:hypothetical protein